MEDTLNEIHRCLIKLNAENKVERKRNLLKIQEILQTKYPLPPKDKPAKLNHREVCTLWTENLHSPLLKGKLLNYTNLKCAQCGKMTIFLPPRFYVKSVLGILEDQKFPFLQLWSL